MSQLNTETLVSLPAASAGIFRESEPYRADGVFVTSDPPGSQLGSGGGTAYLLHEAWRAALSRDPENGGTAAATFDGWLDQSGKLLIHGSGESRRLPAYAAPGKPLTPIPLLRGMTGQRPDQVLLDLQISGYGRLFRHAPPSYRVMVTCGDVLLRHTHWLPRYSEVDVLIVGLVASAEEAQQHGVMICPANDPRRLCCFLQKPSVQQLQSIDKSKSFYLDTGVWLLSQRAIAVLMRKCGWNAAVNEFPDGLPHAYDLFATFGPALGQAPAQSDPEISALTCGVLPLPDGRFYHFGANRGLLTSVAQLQNPVAERRSFGHASMENRIAPIIQHSDANDAPSDETSHIWIENSCVPVTWKLSRRNILTGVPANTWSLALEPGACLDFAPVGGGRHCIRFYGFDDPFRGAIGAETTVWMGRPAPAWFLARGIVEADAGLTPGMDILDAPLFPTLKTDEMDERFLGWLLAEKPGKDDESRRRWLSFPRLSARELLGKADVRALAVRRREYMGRSWSAVGGEHWLKACAQLDLGDTARICAGERWPLPVAGESSADQGLAAMHDRMFRAAVSRRRNSSTTARDEQEAFAILRKLIVSRMEAAPVLPSRNVLDDQIVWGRSPVRLDLAGGWTDTPPYCIEHGGRVVNVAVNINGQPPIQVFGRVSEKAEIVVRSIDLGVEDRIGSYEELVRYGQLGSGFGIARAALALAGLEPRFHACGGYSSLPEQLRAEFGGGIELSMLAAVPKGSGLGTSSILAATLLGTLSELFGLHWTANDLFGRTLALEQMLTSGGGWQDQTGGVIPGLKLIETVAGLDQTPVIRWLPGGFFGPEHANREVLLYYTGLTRVAHGILGEIVRGLFLNSAAHLDLIDDIGQNALLAADAIQQNDWEGLCEGVRRSWHLNQLLDSGTNPPEVQAILAGIGDSLAACKLLGAGGGGYMLMLAKDADAAVNIRRALKNRPPNPRARFVDLGLSEGGFQVTRS